MNRGRKRKEESGRMSREQHRKGNRGGHNGKRHGEGYLALAEPEGTYLLFVGSRSCSRHKGTEKLQLQREGKLSFLCLDEIDWISGGYLDMITEAAEEIIETKKPKHLIIFGGCQIELLSTDYQALTKELSERYQIDVQFHKGCHLTGYGNDLKE
ncbi:MAG: hypothetical protein Q4C52_07820 [Eubacteriales bacterium]|nr:hypothetical protein [Eubacteriales bacterium]